MKEDFTLHNNNNSKELSITKIIFPNKRWELSCKGTLTLYNGRSKSL